VRRGLRAWALGGRAAHSLRGAVCRRRGGAERSGAEGGLCRVIASLAGPRSRACERPAGRLDPGGRCGRGESGGARAASPEAGEQRPGASVSWVAAGAEVREARVPAELCRSPRAQARSLLVSPLVAAVQGRPKLRLVTGSALQRALGEKLEQA